MSSNVAIVLLTSDGTVVSADADSVLSALALQSGVVIIGRDNILSVGYSLLSRKCSVVSEGSSALSLKSRPQEVPKPSHCYYVDAFHSGGMKVRSARHSLMMIENSNEIVLRSPVVVEKAAWALLRAAKSEVD